MKTKMFVSTLVNMKCKKLLQLVTFLSISETEPSEPEPSELELLEPESSKPELVSRGVAAQDMATLK
jgi:hypothetical protein